MQVDPLLLSFGLEHVISRMDEISFANSSLHWLDFGTGPGGLIKAASSLKSGRSEDVYFD